MARPIAYEGSEPYIFISYAHKDSDRVLPIISDLQARGFRVWYDAGIEAGTEWPEYIAEHLESCTVFLAFLSQSALDSPNCRREINFAIDERKEMLNIYLEELRLSAGMRMQLGVLQAMFYYRHSSQESFLEELCRSRILAPCRGTAVSPVREPELEAIAALFEYTQTGDSGIEITGLKDEDNTKIEIPWGVTSIGEYAFYMCENLISITLPDSVTSIGESAFSVCKNLTSITIPNSVTSIGAKAFLNCPGLRSITIPDSVTSIGTDVFAWRDDRLTICGKRGSVAEQYAAENKIPFSSTCCDATAPLVREPDLEAISALFEYEQTDDGGIEITGLKDEDSTKIEIPWGVTSIGENAFFYCTNLTSITIPDSVTSIGEHAFFNCKNLTNITIPDSVTQIGDCAFGLCEKLTHITIPRGVTSVGNSTFNHCISLTSITIPDSVISIGEIAFADCENLTHITIPHSVTSIGAGAFHYCRKLTSITIPDSVTGIGNDAFQACKLTIRGKRGSVAEQYAAENNIPFSAI